MRLTITGPRSVGKTKVSKIVAKKLKLLHAEADEILNKALKKQGGLSAVIKSGDSSSIYEVGLPLTRNVVKERNILYDLAGGAIASRKNKKMSKEIVKIITEETIVIGLLPYKDDEKSIELLFRREKKRKHFKRMDKDVLLKKVKEDYANVSKKVVEAADILVYTGRKKPKTVAKEVMRRLALFIA